MNSVTQDMRYRQSLLKYSEKYGVTKAAIKYKTNRQYIYRWRRRYDGTLESLRDKSRRPHHHPITSIKMVPLNLQYMKSLIPLFTAKKN